MPNQHRVTGRRIVAFLIDTVVGFAVYWSLVVALAGESQDTETPGVFVQMSTNFANGQMHAELMGTTYILYDGTAALVVLGAMVYWIGALVLLQGLTGLTIGKGLVGIRAVNAEGRPCGVGRAAVRWLFLIVDAFPYFIPMLVGFIVTVSTQSRQRVGDIVAKTWVISADALGEPLTNGSARTRPNQERPPVPGSW
jgi:uncharacterized RDD family membrane protein YckC